MNNEHKELLVSRVIEPDATSAQWDELTAAAEADPDLWQRTVQTLRDKQAISRAVNASVAIAEHVSSRQVRQPVRNVDVDRSPLGRPQLSRWSGWAVAALVALAWVSGLSNFGSNGTNTAGLGSSTLTAAELLKNYVTQGRREGLVFDEVPEKILVQTRPSPTGDGVEIIFIRQILERTTLPGLYQYQGEDESGRPTLVRYQANAKPSM